MNLDVFCSNGLIWINVVMIDQEILKKRPGYLVSRQIGSDDARQDDAIERTCTPDARNAKLARLDIL